MSNQSGIPVARIELLDELQVKAINDYAKLDYPVKPTLFFEFHGTEAGAREQAELVGEIARDYVGANFKWATRQADRTKLLQARQDAYFATLAMKPGAKDRATAVCLDRKRVL